MTTIKRKEHYHGHRARLLKRVMHNLSSVEEYELLEALLTFVQPRKDVKKQAKDIISHAGSIRTMVNSSSLSYTHIEGIGEQISWYCALIIEIAKRYTAIPSIMYQDREHLPSEQESTTQSLHKVTSFADVQRYLLSVDINSYQENEFILYINIHKEIVAMEAYTFSDENKALIPHVLHMRPASIILVRKIAQEHYMLNKTDVTIIKKREQALSLFAIMLLDYVICTPSIMVSLQQYSVLQCNDSHICK